MFFLQSNACTSQYTDTLYAQDKLLSVGLNRNEEGKVVAMKIAKTELFQSEVSSACDCELLEELIDECSVLLLPEITHIHQLEKGQYLLLGYQDLSPFFVNHLWVYDLDQQSFINQNAFITYRRIPPDLLLEQYLKKEVTLESFSFYQLNKELTCFKRQANLNYY